MALAKDDTGSVIVIVGGGIVGIATAMALVGHPSFSVIVLEAEPHLAAHQSGHNTGVIHSGVFYRPGTLKARLCVEGREAMYRFCREHSIPHEQCGKVVVARHEADLPSLDTLEEWSRANGLHGVQRLDAGGIRQFEPHARGIAGLHVPEAGIVDYAEVTRVLADRVRQEGGTIRLGTRLLGCLPQQDGLVLRTSQGDIRCRLLINCAGLQSDRVARLCGVEPGVSVVPFRGQFYGLLPQRGDLVHNLVYPVPDLSLPFLGIHLTRTVRGTVEADPNGALAFKREGYRALSFSVRDTYEMISYRGYWGMLFKHLGTGLLESVRAVSARAFARPLQEIFPELRANDLRKTRSGVRAQAVAPGGSLADDFRIVEADRSIHVLNAVSPAATASLSLGQLIAERALRQIGLNDSPTHPPGDPAS